MTTSIGVLRSKGFWLCCSLIVFLILCALFVIVKMEMNSPPSEFQDYHKMTIDEIEKDAHSKGYGGGIHYLTHFTDEPPGSGRVGAVGTRGRMCRIYKDTMMGRWFGVFGSESSVINYYGPFGKFKKQIVFEGYEHVSVLDEVQMYNSPDKPSNYKGND